MLTRSASRLLALAVILSAIPAFAEDGASTAPGVTTEPAAEAAEGTTPLIMTGLDQIGVGKTVSDYGFQIFGYIDSGYTYGLKHGSGGEGGDTRLRNRTFDEERGNHYQLDQVDLVVERLIADRSKFDIGGRMEWMYGMDTYQLHSHGMDFYDGGGVGSFGVGGDPHNPLNQFDLAQLYLDVNLPVFRGVNVRLGKFFIPVGFESTNLPDSPLYSQGLVANFAQPGSSVGVLVSTELSDQFAVSTGILRGFEQSLEDNNGAVSWLGSLSYKPTDKVTITGTYITGPELSKVDFPEYSLTGHYANLFDLVASYAVTDKLNLALNADYGDTSFPSGTGNSFADWYGIATYAQYSVSKYATLTARAEWFYDSDSLRLPSTAGGNMNIYELTLGVTLIPFPDDKLGRNLRFRPEIRWDHAEDPVFNNFGGVLRDRDQVTVACDVIVRF